MAKRRRVRRARKAAADSDRAPAVCKLRTIQGSIDFAANTGEAIELFTHDQIGLVRIAKAEYGGQQLVPPGQAVSRLQFDALAGRNTMKMVFVFSASINGRRELREQCDEDESQFLRALVGREPLQIMRIVGS